MIFIGPNFHMFITIWFIYVYVNLKLNRSLAKAQPICYILNSNSFFYEKGKLLERVGRKTVSPPLL